MRSSSPLLVSLILGLFAATAVFGMGVSMKMDSRGNMGTCPFMQGGASICQMDIMQHLRAWQSVFATTIPTVIVLIIIFTLILGFSSSPEGNRSEIRYLHRTQDTSSIPFDHIRKALGRGILHPKIHESSPVAD